MIRKLLYLCASLLCVAALAGIGIGTVLAPTTSTFEKRDLAQRPAWPQLLADWQAFPKAFEAWWTDAIWRRQEAVTLFNRLREAVGISPQANVLLGRDGWLFFTGEDVLDDYRNARLYTDAELARWKAYLLYRHADAQAHGAVYYLVVPPNKHTVYAEYLPRHVRQLSPASRLDQIIALMAGTGVRIIDLRPAMQEAKQYRQAYHKGDTHWNLWGANYAQYAILSQLREDFPQLQPVLYPLQRFVDAGADAFVQAGLPYYNGLYYMLGVAGQRHEPQPLLVGFDQSCIQPASLPLGRWENANARVRERVFVARQCAQGHYRALLFRDSFSELLQPFFSTTFAYTAYIRIRRPVGLHFWQHFMQAVQPDIVIDEVIARHLRHIPEAGADYPADFRGPSA